MSKHTMVYSATNANRHFSKMLKRVEKGETVLITSRNRVIAEMRPREVLRRPRRSFGESESRHCGS
jgi:antitoxin (DNA-binding transcriptional repressor) of toxin-antitoxin stability system